MQRSFFPQITLLVLNFNWTLKNQTWIVCTYGSNGSSHASSESISFSQSVPYCLSVFTSLWRCLWTLQSRDNKKGVKCCLATIWEACQYWKMIINSTSAHRLHTSWAWTRWQSSRCLKISSKSSVASEDIGLSILGWFCQARCTYEASNMSL